MMVMEKLIELINKVYGAGVENIKALENILKVYSSLTEEQVENYDFYDDVPDLCEAVADMFFGLFDPYDDTDDGPDNGDLYEWPGLVAFDKGRAKSVSNWRTDRYPDKVKQYFAEKVKEWNKIIDS